jgi:hypothetical protein
MQGLRGPVELMKKDLSETNNMSTEISTRTHSHLDTIGACVSFACAVHCVALPLVITLLPLLGLGFLAGHAFESAMLIIAVSLATASLCWGSSIHGKRQILLFLLAAVILFSSGFFMFEGNKHWVLIGLGGFCLAAGHILNRRLCRACAHCKSH